MAAAAIFPFRDPLDAQFIAIADQSADLEAEVREHTPYVTVQSGSIVARNGSLHRRIFVRRAISEKCRQGLFIMAVEGANPPFCGFILARPGGMGTTRLPEYGDCKTNPPAPTQECSTLHPISTHADSPGVLLASGAKTGILDRETLDRQPYARSPSGASAVRSNRRKGDARGRFCALCHLAQHLHLFEGGGNYPMCSGTAPAECLSTTPEGVSMMSECARQQSFFQPFRRRWTISVFDECKIRFGGNLLLPNVVKANGESPSIAAASIASFGAEA